MSLFPFTFKNVEFKVVTIIGKPWTRAKEVCKALEYSRSVNHVMKDHCSRENYAHKYDLSKWSAAAHLLNWLPGSRKDDYYFNKEGMHKFNRFAKEGHVERKYNHFRLIDLTRDNLYDMGIPGI